MGLANKAKTVKFKTANIDGYMVSLILSSLAPRQAIFFSGKNRLEVG